MKILQNILREFMDVYTKQLKEWRKL